MFAVNSSRSAPITPRSPSTKATVAVALIALVVAALLALSLSAGRASHPATASAHTERPYTPLIQYRGTGQPAPGATHRTAGGPPATGLLQAEHSYGAVP